MLPLKNGFFEEGLELEVIEQNVGWHSFRDLLEGRLASVIPAWQPRGGIFHAVFPSRRGLLPAVRALLDFLAESLDEVDFAIPEKAAEPDFSDSV